MILRVNPNRMELLRLRRRLLLAQRGHKLLQDKLEELMRKFMNLLKDIDIAKENFQVRTQNVLRDLLYCRITSSKDNFIEALSKIESKLSLSISTMRIMNVTVPEFNIGEFIIDKQYDFFTTSAQLDLVVAGAKDYLYSL